MQIDWYEKRDELCEGQVFRTIHDEIVRLDRRVPGDGTQWYVDDWYDGWSCYDSTIEPGDLVEMIDGEELANYPVRTLDVK